MKKEYKDYVSLKVAKLLRDRGYREPSNGIYRKVYINEEEELSLYTGKWKYDEHSENIIAPSLYDAHKWLKEEKKILVQMEISEDKPNTYFITVFNISEELPHYICGVTHTGTYEECLDYAIEQGILIAE